MAASEVASIEDACGITARMSGGTQQSGIYSTQSHSLVVRSSQAQSI